MELMDFEVVDRNKSPNRTMDNRAIENKTVAELYFLITKFLANGPFKAIGDLLVAQIEQEKILPPRVDWLGERHQQTFAELERQYTHIGPNHLLEICSRITSLLNKDLPPSVAGIATLLGAGQQSVLRSQTKCIAPKSLVDYCTRSHGMPLLDSNLRITHNIAQVLYGREAAGPVPRRLTVPKAIYRNIEPQRRTLGHLSAVYCVLFDRTGQYIITGADDLLVKLWSAVDGRLLFTFRGASAEITDIAINLENTLLAAGSLDHILRVWDLQSASPIAVLCCHTGMITSVNFCPSPRDYLKYLVTTSTDGSVAFWQYSTSRDGKTQFAPKPTQYLEKIRPGQAQMIYASFSPGGLFLAAGSADHHVRVYNMSDEGPKRILETEAHSDTVDSIQWAHNSLRFASGSKDGTALVWHFEAQQWKSMRLDMTERTPSCPPPADEKKVLKVTMVGWDISDKYVVTAVNDFSIKVWDADTGRLHKVMRGHDDELYVLESHPKDPHVLISAGHDGRLCIWDIFAGVSLATFTNQIEGQGHGGVFDVKWSPDGTMIAATDSHGHLIMYGFGPGHKRLKELPIEMFFHTDYRPLIRDSGHYVLDEQTQTVPHLMPPPFLVDVDGNPHPPPLQRLVPGRENCTSDQLVPNISVGPDGVEVVNPMSHIDRLIQALANRQGQGGMADGMADERNQNQNNGDAAQPNAIANAQAALDMLRGGNVGGVYQEGAAPGQMAAEAANQRIQRNQRYQNIGFVQGLDQPNGPVNNNRLALIRRAAEVAHVHNTPEDMWLRDQRGIKWLRRMYVRPMKHSRLQRLKQTVHAAGQRESEFYRREMRRRPIMISTSSPNSSQPSRAPTNVRGRRIGRVAPGAQRSLPTYRTRAVREQEQQQPEEEDISDDDHSATSVSTDSSDGTVAEDQMSSSSSSDEDQSSGYSDWVGQNDRPTLQPPKRSKRKRVKPRSYSPSTQGTSRQTRRNIPLDDNGEIPEVYRPPEWLSEVVPRKMPYYPQMGDEIVYFRQGHKLYLDAVQMKNLYRLAPNPEPWARLDLRDFEFVKVIGIKYEIRPPRLCCLKLGLMNASGLLTGQTFTIKYHDMAGVLDFLVLKQTYDMAVQRLWSTGDRFRCMIEDGWWMGEIINRVPYDANYPNSLFMCFHIHWDGGEQERMSPWDMEPINDERLPDEVGGVVEVLPEERQATLYLPSNNEWPRNDRDATCRRIAHGLEGVMRLAIAEPFITPVDLNIYPTYAFIVEYPIDLQTIKSRFENHFYRRVASAQFDVRYLATNAEKFNESDSPIVRNARIITELCLRIIEAPGNIDVNAVYHQLNDTYLTDSESDQEAGPSTPRTPANCRRSRRNRPGPSSSAGSSGNDWRSRCRQLLEMIWNHEDSEPFREPVNTIEHPDYLQIVDTPMDLMSVREDLRGGNYTTLPQFLQDMRLIFTNSRRYNTNARSRIYSMTLRLSQLFEEKVKTIHKRSPGATPRSSRANGHGSAVTNGSSRRRRQRLVSDDDDDNEVDVVNGDQPSTSTSRAARSAGRSSRATNPSTNGVSSSHSGPSRNRQSRSRRDQTTRHFTAPNSSSSDDDEQEALSDSSSTSDSDSDASAWHSPEKPKSAKAKKKKKKKKKAKKANKKSKQNGRMPKRKQRRAMPDDDEDDDEEVDVDAESPGPSGLNGSQTRGRTRKRQVLSESEQEEAAEDDDEDDVEIEVEEEQFEDAQTDEEEQEQEQDSDEEQEDIDEDEQDNRQSGRARKAARRYDSDESYEATPATKRKRQLQTYDEAALSNSGRPTRSATKRSNPSWMDEDSDDDGPSPSSSHNVSSTRRVQQAAARTRRQIMQDDPEELSLSTRARRTTRSQESMNESRSQENGTSLRSRNSTQESIASRSLEGASTSSSTRNNASRSQNSDESDSSSEDDQVLSTFAQPSPVKRVSRRATTTTTTQSIEQVFVETPPARQNGSLARTRELIRRRQTTTHTTLTSSASSSSSRGHNVTRSSTSTIDSSSQIELRRSAVQADHNYGEPGPSARPSRRVTQQQQLSRHQRNPDELDKPNESAESDPLRITNRLRRSPRATHSPAAHVSNEDSDDDDDDDDDDAPLVSYCESTPQPGPSQSVAMSSTRSSRAQKRPYYNEDSDAEEDDASNRGKRRPTQSASGRSTWNSSGPGLPRNKESNRSRYIESESSNDDYDDVDDEQQEISVSSRGRVRKISTKVRGFYCARN